MRAALDARGLCDAVVETANKLQGLECEATFVWHPLSGLPEADEFHLVPGRMYVLLTQHRHACVVVGRAGDRDLLDDRPPPPTTAYLGRDPDPMLDGWGRSTRRCWRHSKRTGWPFEDRSSRCRGVLLIEATAW